MIAILCKEVNGYFKGILGYLFTAFILIFAGIYTMAYNLSGYYANFEYVLDSISFIYLIAVPILSMRTVAEEKRQKTDQLLYSLPLSLTSVIVGKYLAMLVVLLVPVAIMALYPVVLSQFGTVSFATAYTGLAGFFMLGACLMSIGLFISSVSESQVASAVITLVVMLILYYADGLASFVSTTASTSLQALCIMVVIFAVVLYLLSRNSIVSMLVALGGISLLIVGYAVDSSMFVGLFGDILTQLSLFDRFYTFISGLFDLTAVVYYGSIIVVFLFLSTQAMEKRRWSE